MHSLYDFPYGGDEESVSGAEVSQRARRTRKDTEKAESKVSREPKLSKDQKGGKYNKDAKSGKEDTTQKKSENRYRTARRSCGQKVQLMVIHI
mgnify:CR=1 FL=1